MLTGGGVPALVGMRWEEVGVLKGQSQSSWSNEREEQNETRLATVRSMYSSVHLSIPIHPSIYLSTFPAQNHLGQLTHHSMKQIKKRGDNEENKTKRGD